MRGRSGRAAHPELRRVGGGRSDIEAPRGDHRFTDPAWDRSWLFHRLLQGYLAVGETVDGLISDSDVDWRAERRARLAAGNLIDALAPTLPVVEPRGDPGDDQHRRRESGPRCPTTGARPRHPPRLPATVDTGKFEVGGNLAVSPGAVVLRTEVFELIQYQPATGRVRAVPLLFVPPTINKFYVLDISPGRSMIEHFVSQGQQVFAISWRNPEQAQGHFDLDTYANAVAQARDAAASITEQSQVHLAAACSGGIVTVGLLGQLAASGELDEVASLTLMVCGLDSETEGTMSALASRDVAATAVAESARKGYLDGQALQGVFTWLRSNDFVWNYVVNNYLLGKDPPAFDILLWNQDTVRLAAGLHRDFINIGLDNSFMRVGALEVLGQPVDLRRIDLDTYFVAGLTDHIVPWESAYQGARLFGGERRFVLSSSGHVQALVNPPPAPGAAARTSYRVADALPEPRRGLAQAPSRSGSWWSDWERWLAELRPAPQALGNRAHKAQAQAPAPGTYVLAH